MLGDTVPSARVWGTLPAPQTGELGRPSHIPSSHFLGGVGEEKLSTKRASGLSWNLQQGCILVVREVGRPRPGRSSDLEACPALPPEVLALAEMQRPAL